MNLGDRQRAYDCLCEALETLGRTYFDATVLDDTDLGVLVAQDLYQQANVGGAVNILQGVVATRLRLFEEKVID